MSDVVSMVNLADVPTGLRQLANQIDSGHINVNNVVVALAKNNGEADYAILGGPINGYMALGLMEAIKAILIRKYLTTPE